MPRSTTKWATRDASSAYLGSTGESFGWVEPPFDLPVDDRFDEIDPFTTEAIDGFACAPSFTLLICEDSDVDGGDASQLRRVAGDGSTSFAGGPGWGPFDGPDGPIVLGRWRWALPNESDTAILGQWSGECEVPSAHLIVDGVVRGLGQDSEGQVRLVEATDSEFSSLQSWALGWLPDGRAAIHVSSGPCSTEAADGIYAVALDGSVEQLVRVAAPVVWIERTE